MLNRKEKDTRIYIFSFALFVKAFNVTDRKRWALFIIIISTIPLTSLFCKNENQLSRNEIKFGTNKIQFSASEVQLGRNEIQFSINEIYIQFLVFYFHILA